MHASLFTITFVLVSWSFPAWNSRAEILAQQAQHSSGDLAKGSDTWVRFSPAEFGFSIGVPKRLPEFAIHTDEGMTHITTGEAGFAITIGVVSIPRDLAERYSPGNIEAITREVLEGFVLGYSDQGLSSRAVFDRSLTQSGERGGEGHVDGLPGGIVSRTRAFVHSGHLYSVTVAGPQDKTDEVGRILDSFEFTGSAGDHAPN